MKNFLKISFLALVFAIHAKAQLQVGERVDLPALLNVQTNTEWSVAENKNPILVVIFVSHNCPYFKLYESRILSITKDFSAKNVSFVCVNSNNPIVTVEDSEVNMKKSASEKSYSFPYLSDKKQVFSEKIGAIKTPEVFVFNNKNGSYYLKYKGAIDDNPQVESDVKNNYLKNALDVLLAGKSLASAETKTVGCMIKK